MASIEYCMWHLTPNGWVNGTVKTDSPKLTNKPIPNDRVLTYKYEERMKGAEIISDHTEIFRIDDNDLIDKLLKKYPFKGEIIL
ncbi:hypothetical protein [Paenimyroides baculatum]|uniref:Uncharacterized protein n=1 Tax=Paenimyroides baculatum TaxID=2608000 RepID=A0A5M6CIM9_9FLAO|nr:hypothetical protein [Paenimyroides baculatum]KAA5534310.1 hypothetical protein F0460_09385 [Paenimyroides baculatum]